MSAPYVEAGTADKPRILWLTDVQARYREPMWRELAALADFTVAFMFHDERGRNWGWRATDQYRSSVVPTWRVPLPAALARRLAEPAGVLKPGVTRRILRGIDVLVVQNWWQPANLWCILRAKLRRVPYVVYAESTLQSRHFRTGLPAWVRSLVFRHAGAVLVPGPSAREAVVTDGTPVERVIHSVNSFDVDAIRRGVAKLRAGRPDEPVHRFVYVGRLVELKNVEALVRAFAAATTAATLDIAGDGVLLGACRQAAYDCGVGDRVRFHGHLDQPDVIALLAGTHTLVLPSAEEVYGFTAVEAYVAGLQVVVSGRAGVAANLSGRPGVWVVEPTEDDIGRALAAAQDKWGGYHRDVDADFASPRRAARDVLRAALLAVGDAPHDAAVPPSPSAETESGGRSSEPGRASLGR